MHKQIDRNSANKDYDMYLDGQYIGSARTYREAEVTLDQVVFDRLSRQTREVAMQILDEAGY